MLKELRPDHWKSFEKATLYIDPLTIIIGTNASGKSSTLDALLFFYKEWFRAWVFFKSSTVMSICRLFAAAWNGYAANRKSHSPWS